MAIPSDGFLNRAHQHRSEVTRYFYRITGHLQDAEDLVNEVYARLVRVQGMDQLADRALRAYVLLTARRVGFDWRKSRNRSRVDFTSDPLEDCLITREDTPEQHLIAGELAERLDAAINDLPPVRRRVFELSRFEDLRCEAIARQLGSEPNTVKKHLVMALAQLRKALFGQGDSHD